MSSSCAGERQRGPSLDELKPHLAICVRSMSRHRTRTQMESRWGVPCASARSPSHACCVLCRCRSDCCSRCGQPSRSYPMLGSILHVTSSATLSPHHSFGVVQTERFASIPTRAHRVEHPQHFPHLQKHILTMNFGGGGGFEQAYGSAASQFAGGGFMARFVQALGSVHRP